MTFIIHPLLHEFVQSIPPVGYKKIQTNQFLGRRGANASFIFPEEQSLIFSSNSWQLKSIVQCDLERLREFGVQENNRKTAHGDVVLGTVLVVSRGWANLFQYHVLFPRSPVAIKTTRGEPEQVAYQEDARAILARGRGAGSLVLPGYRWR